MSAAAEKPTYEHLEQRVTELEHLLEEEERVNSELEGDVNRLEQEMHELRADDTAFKQMAEVIDDYERGIRTWAEVLEVRREVLR